MGLVLQKVDYVEHHMNVCARLAFAGQCRTIDDFESGKVERWPKALISLRIQVTAPDQDAPTGIGGCVIGKFELPNDPVHPLERLTSKAVSDGLIEFPKAGVNIIEVNEESTFQFLFRHKTGVLPLGKGLKPEDIPIPQPDIVDAVF